MKITALAIPEVKLVTPKIFRDDRGFFSETFNVRALAAGAHFSLNQKVVSGRAREI